MEPFFVDIHCHLVPEIDDGAADQETAIAMARMAAADGIRTIVATPHQLGNFAGNRGELVRRKVAELDALLAAEDIPLNVLPGADVRIEDGMMAGLLSGDVLTLADRKRHVLLELPHELYFPLEPVLEQLAAAGLDGVLSHPERNLGLLGMPRRLAALAQLVDRGCLMQVTTGSLLGSFGPASQELAEQMLQAGLVHFLATDAHGIRSRRPLLSHAFARAAELAGEQAARQICCENPARVAEGRDVLPGRMEVTSRRGGWRRFFSFKRAA